MNNEHPPNAGQEPRHIKATITQARFGLYLWASRQKRLGLAEFFAGALDGATRGIVKDLTARGKPVPQWVGEVLRGEDPRGEIMPLDPHPGP